MAKFKGISKLPNGTWPGFLLAFAPLLARTLKREEHRASLLWMKPGRKDSLIVCSSDGHFLVQAEVGGLGYTADLPKGGCVYCAKDLLKISRMPSFSINGGVVCAASYRADPRTDSSVPPADAVLKPRVKETSGCYLFDPALMAATMSGVATMMAGFLGEDQKEKGQHVAAAAFRRPYTKVGGQLYAYAGATCGGAHLRIAATLMIKITSSDKLKGLTHGE
jgi:hypothetical protein